MNVCVVMATPGAYSVVRPMSCQCHCEDERDVSEWRKPYHHLFTAMGKRSHLHASRMANLGEYAQKKPPPVQPPKRRRANTIGDRIPSPESCDKENTNPVMVILIFASHLSYCLTHRGLLRQSLSHAGWHQKDISPRLLLYPSLILQHHLGMPRCPPQLLHMQKSLHDDRINHRQALQSAGKPCRTSGKSCFLTVSVAVPSSNSKAIGCFIVAFS